MSYYVLSFISVLYWLEAVHILADNFHFFYVLEEDEELLENQQENGEGAEAIGDDTTDLDLSATGTTKS